MQSASGGSVGVSAPVGDARGSGAIRVVPSSIPGMRQHTGAASIPLVGATGRVESGMTLNAVRQAILRAQRGRPVVGAGVVEVER
jgi:hypothetical protein